MNIKLINGPADGKEIEVQDTIQRLVIPQIEDGVYYENEYRPIPNQSAVWGWFAREEVIM